MEEQHHEKMCIVLQRQTAERHTQKNQGHIRVRERLQHVETASPWQQSDRGWQEVMVGLKKVLLPLSVVWLLATNDLIAADESIQSEMEQ